jgi:hypothetical protein
MLQLCLVNNGESISNQFWQVTERDALKSFFDSNTIHMAWTQEEDERLLDDYLVVGPRCTGLAMIWEMRGVAELKNGWHRVSIKYAN